MFFDVAHSSVTFIASGAVDAVRSGKILWKRKEALSLWDSLAIRVVEFSILRCVPVASTGTCKSGLSVGSFTVLTYHY